MEIRWVMSESDRMTLWKQKLEKYNQKSKSQTKDNLLKPLMSLSISQKDRDALEHLTTLQTLVFRSMPYPDECVGDTTAAMANLFYCICQKIRSFFYRVEDFRQIDDHNQAILLRNGISLSIYLHGAFNYDVTTRSWPAPEINDALKIPTVTRKTLRQFTVLPELFNTFELFYSKYGPIMKNETVLALICVISLFQEGDMCSTSSIRSLVSNLFNQYIRLLRSYFVSIHGEERGTAMMVEVMSSFGDIKKIVSYHRLIDIRHSVDAIKMIRSNEESLDTQSSAVSSLLSSVLQGKDSFNSSVASIEERINKQLDKRKKGLTWRRPDPMPDPGTDFLLFHPITNITFPPDTTDRLFSVEHENILNVTPRLKALMPDISETKQQSKPEEPGCSSWYNS